MLLWTSICKCLCGYMSSFLLSTYPGVELLNYVTAFNFLKNCQTVPQQPHLFTFLLAEFEGSSVSTSWPTFLSVLFLLIAILLDMRWYLIVLLICIFLISNDVGQFPWAYGPFVHLWRNAYSNPLPILKFLLLSSCLHFGFKSIIT